MNATTGIVEDVIQVEDQPIAVAVGDGSVWVTTSHPTCDGSQVLG